MNLYRSKEDEQEYKAIGYCNSTSTGSQTYRAATAVLASKQFAFCNQDFETLHQLLEQMHKLWTKYSTKDSVDMAAQLTVVFNIPLDQAADANSINRLALMFKKRTLL